MDDPQANDAAARNRWLAMNAIRLSGAVMVMIGILMLRNVIPSPQWAGYLVLAIGLADVFVVPQVLARKWRSPRP